MRLLLAALLLPACATPADDPMVPPPPGPVIYKRPDCPNSPRIAVRRPSGDLSDQDPIKTFASGTIDGALVLTHGGAGSKPELADGPKQAAQEAMKLLLDDKPALEAAIEGTVVMEDDPRFNAGTGSNIRLDGKTIQMDAALMTTDGEFAAVAVIERVKNPIRVARLVLDSPHVLMAGEGATRFAHRLGMKDEIPVCEPAMKKYQDRMARLSELTARMGNVDWRALWNYPTEMPPEIQKWAKGGDTVGTVVRDREGAFAATLSTGGTSLTLYGRVGDVPVYGAGLFAGQHGAVACTGEGEQIIKNALARTVYLAIEAGTPARDAVSRAVREFPEEADVGLIAVDRFGWAVAANTEMAYGKASEEPEPGK